MLLIRSNNFEFVLTLPPPQILLLPSYLPIMSIRSSRLKKSWADSQKHPPYHYSTPSPFWPIFPSSIYFSKKAAAFQIRIRGKGSVEDEIWSARDGKFNFRSPLSRHLSLSQQGWICMGLKREEEDENGNEFPRLVGKSEGCVGGKFWTFGNPPHPAATK